MKVTNLDIWNSREAMEKLLQEKLPAEEGYKLATLARALTSEWGVLEQARVNIVRNHGDADGNGGFTCERGSEAWGNFVKDWSEILEKEVELDAKPINLPKGMEVDANIIVALYPFLDME